MQTALDSAHAWFLESMVHELNGVLIVRLVEGIKGKERQFVDVGETKLGPFFPVQVEAASRCAEVRFPNAIAFFAYIESYDAPDPELKKDTGRFLFVAESSSFRRFAEARTSVAQLHQEPYQEFLLCCEDRIFQVLSSEAPAVTFLNEQPQPYRGADEYMVGKLACPRRRANPALNLAPFGRWTLRDRAAQRRLALR